MIVYNKTNIGYSHVEKNVVCQDYSEKYVDDNYVIITACDGHGGDIYIRSDRGSKFASQAIIDVFKSYEKQELESIITGNNLNKTKLQILCRWNELIERDYSIENFTDEELKQLDEEQVFKLRHNFVIAYGTTLNAAIIFAV